MSALDESAVRELTQLLSELKAARERILAQEAEILRQDQVVVNRTREMFNIQKELNKAEERITALEAEIRRLRR